MIEKDRQKEKGFAQIIPWPKSRDKTIDDIVHGRRKA